MNQIIGPKLSKSDTFYESLLTSFSSENGCVGQGLSDPSVFRQLENDRNSPADCMHHMWTSEFALNSCPATPATQRLKARHVCRCYGSAEAQALSKRSYRKTFSASSSNAHLSSSGAQRTGQQSALGKQTLVNTKRPRTSRLIPWPFRC